MKKKKIMIYKLMIFKYKKINQKMTKMRINKTKYKQKLLKLIKYRIRIKQIVNLQLIVVNLIQINNWLNEKNIQFYVNCITSFNIKIIINLNHFFSL